MSQAEARMIVLHTDPVEVRRRYRNALKALRMRRARRWDKVLGRRADGRPIRPIGPHGHFGGDVLDATEKTALLHYVEDELLREATGARLFWCEGCGRVRTCAVRDAYQADEPRRHRDIPWCRNCHAEEHSPEGHLPPWATSDPAFDASRSAA